MNSIFSKDSIHLKKIIVFPDSRKKEKSFPETLNQKIIKGLNNIQVQIAKFGKENNVDGSKDIIYYDNFSQLAQLIKNTDFIISSDSLPAHLAYYFNIPHWIIYNKKVNTEWLTPYCKENHNYSLFYEMDNLFNYVNENLC
jgi:ADP-heptose:LPS heptosyltransferase